MSSPPDAAQPDSGPAGRQFTVDVPESELEDLRQRLRTVRWPREAREDGWERGTEIAYMRELVDHWLDGYDWRRVERRLNALDQRVIDVGDLELHFIRADAEAGAGAIPIVLLHGWPDSILRYLDLIAELTSDDADGPAFDVVVPSLPGFGFSGEPADGELTVEFCAEAVVELMDALGHERFAVHGGDWGSAIAQQIGIDHPDRVIGLHLTDVPMGNYAWVDREGASGAELELLEEVRVWMRDERAYARIQGTKPRTLGYALSDSPVALAAWIAEKLKKWTERMPDVDTVLDHVTIAWLTNTGRSGIRLYNESDPRGNASIDAPPPRVEVPTAVAIFPFELVHPPRELAERFFDVRRWNEPEHGGHFAALEVPGVLAADIRAFFGELG